MRIASVNEMLEIEEEATKQLAISTRDLMENAGKAIADEAAGMVSAGEHIVIVCGKGNNGGDGFVAARYLNEMGYVPTVFALAPAEQLSEDARDALSSLHAASVKSIILDEYNLDNLAAGLRKAALIIDSVFGFSLKGAVRGIAGDVIKIINVVSCPTLSVDIPSGLESDTGRIHGVCVWATKTVTFTCPKNGLVTYPGADTVGDLVVADIGVPREIVERISRVEAISASEASELLPERKPDAHKREVGQVLVIAGSQGMTGAAALASESALRSGAGLVMLGIPSSLNTILEQKLTEVMTVPLPETSERTLDAQAYEKITELSSSFDVIAIGPGISRNQSSVSLVRKLVASLACPLIIDADGLNALISKVKLLKERSGTTIITPHLGEFSRLVEVPVAEIQQDRMGFARKAAEEWGVVIVLKGARSLVVSPEKAAIILAGNPGMASAGTGDVLTGFITSYLAQGLDPYEAAVLGAYLHGLSGDLAANELTEWCLVASDLIRYLPKAIKKVQNVDKRCSTSG